ncbi:MAG: ABC transporter permease subunit [Trueperaceae bacterium]|nr:MAG: ABC transporter permease subunit [Trueperaceae bacterium]
MATAHAVSTRRDLRFSGAWIPALIAGIAFLALPFGRPDRAFFTLDPAFRPWALGSLWVWLVLAFALLALIASLLPLRVTARGELLTVAGGLGLLSGVSWLMGTGTPFGMGALLSLIALVVVTGYGLSESGRIQSDAFVASSILFVSLFIILFILFPLFIVLRTAVFVDGSFTLNKVWSTLNSPLFIFAENPYTEQSELALMSRFAVIGTVLGALWALSRRLKFARFALTCGVAAAVGFFIGFMIYGRGALPTSLLVATIVATVSTLTGLVFALLGQRTRFGFVQRSLGAISLLPIITPPFILAFALIFMFGRRGIVTYQLFDISSNAIFGIVGVSLAQILAFTPIAYLVIRGSVASLDPALEEASQTLGADRWTLFRTVTWPLLRPGLANAFLLTVIESFADFGNPLILGGDRGYLATEVFSAFAARFDPNEAAVYGSVLLSMVLVIFFAQRWWLGRSSFVTVTGKPSSGSFAHLPRVMEGLLLSVFALWTLLVLMLYFSILYGSFVQLWGINNTLTLKNYRDFMTIGWPVFLYTARVAAVSAIPAAFLGFLIAYLVVRQRFFGRSFVEFGSMLSFATPGTVMGVAYILAFNVGPWLLTASSVIIAIAFVFRNMPVAIRGGVAGLAQIDPSLEEASTTLRASSSVTLRRILVPLLIIPLIGGLIFAFVRAMTAISQVIFLVSPGNMLATVLLLGWVEQGQLGRAAAMGSILIVSMLTVILLLMLLTRRRDAGVVGVGA